MSAQNCSRALVKPLGGGSNRSRRRTSAFNAPAKHFHTVGQVRLGSGMHALPITRAAQMSESGSGNQAACGFRRMVNRRQNLPVRLSAIDRIVFEHLAGSLFPCQITKLNVPADRRTCQLVNRTAAVKQTQAR